MISLEYKQMLEAKIKICPSWGSSGHKCVLEAIDVLDEMGALSAVDYGCGTGSLGTALNGIVPEIKVTNYDPVRPPYDVIPSTPSDVVLCVDVMEHVEEDQVDAVIKNIYSLCRTGAYFVIDCRKAYHILPNGTNAHITIKPQGWWTKKLQAQFPIVDCFRTGRNGRTLHYKCYTSDTAI